jgi:hypothetical protein
MSMNFMSPQRRGPSARPVADIQRFASNSEIHAVATKHGYKREAPGEWRHPEGHYISHEGGQIHHAHALHNDGGESGGDDEFHRTNHSSAAALSKHLSAVHGPSKHSDETGAMFSTEGRYDKAHHDEHHKVLIDHGFMYKGHSMKSGNEDYETKGVHHYEHPSGAKATYHPRGKLTWVEYTASHGARNWTHHEKAHQLAAAIKKHVR